MPEKLSSKSTEDADEIIGLEEKLMKESGISPEEWIEKHASYFRKLAESDEIKFLLNSGKAEKAKKMIEKKLCENEQ